MSIKNTTLICYADDNMKTSQALCVQSARLKGDIETVFPWTPEQMEEDQDFYQRNYKIMEATQRGGGKGWWLWKPYICEYALRHYKIGNYVIYADSGVEFIDTIKPLIDLMEKNKKEILLFGNGHTHVMWCKKKVLESMIPNWYDMDAIADVEQVQASVIIFKVSPYTREFARRWLAWSEIPGFIDDSENVGISTQHFRDHRNDQAILTNLAISDNIQLHWWPAQYGHHIKHKYPYDSYGQIFYHHRWRETDWQNNNTTIEKFSLLPKTV